MKKETRKGRDDKELSYLTNNQLTPGELSVIRKLNGGSSVPGGTLYSKRTIEAVLQGRRSNPRLLQSAIHGAAEELERYTNIMTGLLKKLQGPE